MDAVEGVTQEQAEFRPDPDEWSIAEVLHHLLTSSERVAETVEALSSRRVDQPGPNRPAQRRDNADHRRAHSQAARGLDCVDGAHPAASR